MCLVPGKGAMLIASATRMTRSSTVHAPDQTDQGQNWSQASIQLSARLVTFSVA